MVQVQEYLEVAHLGEHERARYEEQRKLPALVTQRKARFVAHDGVHHWEARAEPAHEPLYDHEARDDARDSGSLDVDGQGSLVADSGLVFLLLEEDDAHGEVEKAGPDEEGFPVRDAGHQEGPERDEEGKAEGDGGDYGNLYLIVKNAYDVHVKEAHETRDGVRGAHGESDGDIGESAGDGDGRRDGLELGVLGVGAEDSERRDHENEQPVVEFEMEIEVFQHGV